MTPKQKKFIAEYLVDLNATQAAIRAGYSPRSAKVTACQMLGQPEISEAVRKTRERQIERAEISVERVLRELAAVGMADIRKLYDDKGNLRPIHELDDATAASIAGIETEETFEGTGKDRVWTGYARKVKRADKVKALELLGRHLGLWVDPKAPEKEGPGLTVVVQNAVHVDGNRVTSAQRIAVSLPEPE
jgi:phage terminase small subunit